MEQINYSKGYSEKYTQVLKALEDALKVIITKQTPLYQANATFLQNLKAELTVLKSDIDTLDEHNFAQLLFLQQNWQLLQDGVQDQLNELDANVNPNDSLEQSAKHYLSQVLSQIKQAFDFNFIAAKLYKLSQEQLILEVFNATQAEIRELTQAKPKCFISYAWGVTEHEQLAAKLAGHLECLGFDVWFDKRSNPAGAFIDYYTAKIHEAHYVILLGSKKLVAKYQAGQALYQAMLAKYKNLDFSQNSPLNPNYIINIELHQIFSKGFRSPGAVIPLLLDGTLLECLPPNELQAIVPIHFTAYRDTHHYCANVFELLNALLPHEAIKTLAIDKQNELTQKLKLLASYVQTDDWKNTLAQYQQNQLKGQREPLEAVKQVVQYVASTHNNGSQPSAALSPSFSPTFFVLNTAQRKHAVPLLAQSSLETPDAMEVCLKTYLKDFYARQAKLQPLLFDDKQFSIETYVNLALIDEKHQQPENQLYKTVQQPLNFYEGFYNPTQDKLIDLKQLFVNEHPTQPCKKILITGRAGVGKTTLCYRLAHLHATDALWAHFKWVFVISLRQLNTKEYAVFEATQDPLVRASQIIKHAFFKIAPVTVEWIQAEILAYPERCLLILDGVDEVSDIVQQPQHALHATLANLMAFENTVMTSRPEFIKGIVRDRHVENIGFLDKDILVYCKRFLANWLAGEPSLLQAWTKALVQFLTSNQRIWTTAHTPINLELICSVWYLHQRRQQTLASDLTMTQLYEEIVYHLTRRYLEKQHLNFIPSTLLDTWSREQIKAQAGPTLLFLEALAFEAMQHQTKALIINQATVNQVLTRYYPDTQAHPQILQDILRAGFLRATAGGLTVQEKDYYFLHLTFQEFFAARYLARKFTNPFEEDTVKNWLHQYQQDSRHKIVMWFVSGLLKDSPYLTTFFERLLRQAPFQNLTQWLQTQPELLFLTLCCLSECELAQIPQKPALLKAYQEFAIKVLVYPNIYPQFTRYVGLLNYHLRLSPAVMQAINIIEVLKKRQDTIEEARVNLQLLNAEDSLNFEKVQLKINDANLPMEKRQEAINLATYLVEQHTLASFIQLLSGALEEENLSNYALNSLIKLYESFGQPAVELLINSVKNSPETTKQKIAHTFFKKGETLGYPYEEKLNCYEIALTFNPKYVDAWHGKGSVLNNLGRDQEKLNSYEQALAIEEKHYGKDHVQVAITLTNLANAYGALGNAAHKKVLLERALAIEEKHYGKDHWQVAIDLNNLGMAYYQLNEWSKAETYFLRALKIYQDTFGSKHIHMAIILINLSMVAKKNQQHLKAQAYLTQALAIPMRAYDLKVQTIQGTWAKLQATHEIDQTLAELSGELMLERALHVFESLYQACPLTENVLKVLALFQLLLQDKDRFVAFIELSAEQVALETTATDLSYSLRP